MLDQNFIETMKEKLLSEKAKLEAELSSSLAHTELGEDLDSQIQEAENDEVSQDVILARKSDLLKIENALEKIEQGTYGIDDEGNEISKERLEVLPWADKAI